MGQTRRAGKHTGSRRYLSFCYDTFMLLCFVLFFKIILKSPWRPSVSMLWLYYFREEQNVLSSILTANTIFIPNRHMTGG